MKVEFLLNGKINFNISSEAKLQLENIKLEFKNILDKYIINEREDLDILLSTHLLNSQKVNELINLRTYIINDLDYNSDYKNLISIQTGFTQFINAKMFLLFASSYQILDDTTKAIKVLKNIIRVQLIERMIEIDYPNREIKIEFLNENYNTKHSDVFTPWGFELFEYIDTNWDTNQYLTKYSEIYHFLFNSMGYGNGKIKSKTPAYKRFVIKHTGNKFSRVLGRDELKCSETILNGLKEDFKKQTPASI